MKFYTGTHHVSHAKILERAMLSVNRLRGRKSDFVANEWIMDSGAFSELLLFGKYRFGVEEYAQQIERWKKCGILQIAVAQDYMCEPFMVERTGLSVKQHQGLTIERYDNLLQLTTFPIMPVLQGYTPEEYTGHLAMYGHRLGLNQWVGVGSVCKRNTNLRQIIAVLEAITMIRPDLNLHGFGLKTTALESAYVCSLLYSADSMAWSYAARREHRNANSVTEAMNFGTRINNIAGSKPTQLELSELAAKRMSQMVLSL
jgi:hypothetical protein